MRLGAKITTDDLSVAEELAEIFDFLEVLYISETSNWNKKISNALVVHAPHHMHEVDLSKKDGNIHFVKDAIEFARKIGAKRVIIHGGMKSEDDHTAENMRELIEFGEGLKIITENLPYKTGTTTNSYSTPAQLKKLLEKTGCGFVLDFSHAAHACFSLNLDFDQTIKEFLKLDPVMFHLYDTKIDRDRDLHLPLGQGDFDIPKLIKLIGDKDATLEMRRPVMVKDFVNSLNYLKKMGIL